MKIENPIEPLIEEAERTIREAVKHFTLKVPAAQIVVTIASAGRKQAVGWFGADHWRNCKPDGIHEINLCSEYLKTHDMGELILHELAHAENRTLGIRDCAGRMHNKKFKTMAERLGLVVKDRDSSVGYGFTDLADGGKDFLKKIAFKHKLFCLARLSGGPKKKAGSRLIKCACPSCGYTVRTTQKWIEAGLPICPCGETMEES